MRKFGFDFLTGFAISPVDYVKLAADLDCPTVSVILDPLDLNPENFPRWSLREDAALRRELVAVTRDRGVAISQGEGFVLTPDKGANAFAADLGLMAELGAQRIGVVSFDPDRARSFDQFAILAEMISAAGMETVMEFAPCFPATPDLASAVAAKAHVGRRDFRILVDTMHFGRSGGTAADLAAVDPDSFGYVQLCDVPIVPPVADYLQEAVTERYPPGEGEQPILEFLSALPRDIVVNCEIPMYARALGGMGPKARMAHIAKAVRTLMEQLESQPA